ncbi:sigma-70 family RNA polymerase sigma factor [Dactylosporangium sp. CA-139066]|uniref:sigma-70 family RNA polymerase sigma factor n=1 Tax=Dactylosporangium sp. CA-139066 TaxID=3239930 RepID=UPI003D91BB41
MSHVAVHAPHSECPEEWMAGVYETHADALYRFLLRLTLGQAELAEDHLQETLLRAWRHRDTLSADIAEVRPWLFTVARRIAIDAARARVARPAEITGIDLAAHRADDDPIERAIARCDIRAALTELSPDHRQVLVELYLRGSSTTEAAATLGLHEGTVKSRTYYARRALRAVLERKRRSPSNRCR